MTYSFKEDKIKISQPFSSKIYYSNYCLNIWIPHCDSIVYLEGSMLWINIFSTDAASLILA